MKTDERFPWWMFVALAVWLAAPTIFRQYHHEKKDTTDGE